MPVAITLSGGPGPEARENPLAASLWNICLLAPVFCLLFTGCTAQRVLLCGGRVHNSSDRDLRDVRIVHQPTGQMLANNLLLAGSDVELAFTDLEMKASAATIDWYDPGLGALQASLVLPRHGQGGGPQRLVYEINGAGQIAVRLLSCQ